MLGNDSSEISFGSYTGGDGDYYGEAGPMQFESGSEEGCDNPRSSDLYFLCLETVALDHVSVSRFISCHTITLIFLRFIEWVGEDPLCHFTAYIYTPLACYWAIHESKRLK